MVANLLASKLTVLYGPSGVGKSSMLKAAVVRRLRELEPDADVVVLGEWAGTPTLPRLDGDAYLILDQFEEYFLYHGEGLLLEELPELLAQPRLHMLISLRDDSLARLDALQAAIPNVLGNRLRVDHLDRAAARAAIVGPLDRWNEIVPPDERVGIEAVLISAVLDEVAAAPAGNGSSAAGLIEAPYLQLVMERVWEEEQAAGSRLLRLDTLERLGGARAIVSAHLQRTLGALSPHDAAIAASALTYLVTPSRTKIAQSFDDLVGYTDEPPAELRGVLDLLAAQRILRAASTDGGADGRRYEIFHDVLAEPVLAWRRMFVASAALAREREAADRRHRRLLVITGGAALLAGAMVALAVYAFAQRNDASKQRSVAERAAVVAVRQSRRATTALGREQRAEKAAKASALRARKAQKAAEQSAKDATAATATANTEKTAAQQSANDANVARARAVRNGRRAEHQTALARAASQRAHNSAVHAKAQELAQQARALLTVDPVESVRRALEAQSRERSPLTEDTLRAAVVADRLRAVAYGGGGPVTSATFSPDGSRILTLADGGGVRLSRADGQLVHKLGSGQTASATFSPDGSLVATAGTDGVRLWNAKDGSSVRALSSIPSVPVLSTGVAVTVAFSGDGRRVAAGGAGGATVWGVDGGVIASMPHDGTVTSVMLDGGGGRLVTVATDSALHQQARIFDVASGSLLHLLPERGITSATFSPDGAWVATTSNDKTARIWDVATGAQHASMSSDGHLLGAEYSHDGTVLVASNEAGGALLWLAPDGTPVTQLLGPTNKVESASINPGLFKFVVIASLDRTARVFRTDGFQVAVLAGNHGGVLDARWSADGTSIVTAGEDGYARVWDPGVAPVLALLGTHAGAVNSLRLSPDGHLAVTAGADKTARIWRLGGAGGSIVLHHDGAVEDAVFSPDGTLVLTGSDDGTARLWRASSGTLVRTLPVGAAVRAVAFSPDGRSVATAAADGSAAVWRASDGTPLRNLTADGMSVRAVAFSPDSSLVATAGDDHLARIWSVTTDAQPRVLSGHTGSISTVSFSSDGERLLTASGDDTARLWSVRSGGLIAKLIGHTGPVTDAEFSRNGKRIVTSSTDSDARLWDGRTGKAISILRGHFGPVQAASFSPNGRWIVTAGPFTVGLWSTATGQLFAPSGSNDPYLRGPTLPVTGVAFAHDGMTIVAGDADGSVRAYRCVVCGGLGELKQRAHELLRESKPG